VYVLAENDCGKSKRVNTDLVDPAKPFCASYWLANDTIPFNGYAYTAGDYTDPSATVIYGDLLLYPTAEEGHTVKVTDVSGALVGYAANQSACAGCCTLIPKPAPEADLQIEKTVAPETPAVGDTVSWSVTASNAGPANALGSTLTDSPPSGLIFSVVSYSYTGGATGPATSTMAALVAGVTVNLPVGGTAVATYTAVIPAGAEGRVLLNGATITPPATVTDPSTTNNTTINMVVVERPCCTTDFYFNFDDVGGGGGCIGIAAGGGRTTYRARDAQIVYADTTSVVTFPPSGQTYLTLDIEATRPPELVGVACAVELEFTTHSSCDTDAIGTEVSFVHYMSDQLNVDPPNQMGWNGSAVLPNVVYSNLTYGAPNQFLAFPSGADWNTADDTAVTGNGSITIVLPVGAVAPMHYLQWWVSFTGTHPLIAFHAGATVRGRWFRGVNV